MAIQTDNYKIFLLLLLMAVFVWSGINPPAGRADWMLENSPILAAVLIFIIFNRYLKFSNLSYTLIVLYLIFPLIASHYGVAGVSFGKTLGGWLGTTRNMYDRLTHFMFGFLGFLPAQDIISQISGKNNFWSQYFLPFQTIATLSVLYEIFEWLAAVSVNPTLAASFYASQGDIFDTPKDMANALVGALVMAAIFFLYSYFHRRKSLRSAEALKR